MSSTSPPSGPPPSSHPSDTRNLAPSPASSSGVITIGGRLESAGPDSTLRDLALSAPAVLPAIPGYTISRELGRGGMGVVYEALQEGLNRNVAIKMILGGNYASVESRRRFLNEAELIAKVRHSGVVDVYAFGLHEGNAYFVMEHVPGGTLADYFAQRRPDCRKSARILAFIARAVQAAHDQGIIHRDLKPANVLMQRDPERCQASKCNEMLETASPSPPSDLEALTPKITDFGLAKELAASGASTSSIIGTPNYMAPEQAQGKRSVGPAADVYSLGAMLYELLTGRPPFEAANSMDTILRVISEPPVPPRQLQADVPRDLDAICLHCLEKHPGQRYASAGALADDLERFLRREPTLARPRRVGFLRLGKKAWHRRILGVAAVALIAAGLWFARDALLREAPRPTPPHKAPRPLEPTLAAKYPPSLVPAMPALPELPPEWRSRPNPLDQHNRADIPDQDMLDIGRGFPSQVPPELQAVFRGHYKGNRNSAKVDGLALNPAGTLAASGSFDGTVIVWDLATAKMLYRVKTPENRIWSVVFSHDGERLAVGCMDATITVWDVRTGRLQACLEQHSTRHSRLAWSLDDRQIVAGGIQANVRFWTPPGRMPTKTWTLPDRPGNPAVRSAAFSPDGTRLVCVRENGWLHVVDVATEKVLWEFQEPDGMPLTNEVMHPTLPRMAVAGDRATSRERAGRGWIREFDLQTGEVVHEFIGHTNNVNGLAYRPDGAVLASAAIDGTVRFWDTRTPATQVEAIAVLGDPLFRGQQVHQVVFTPDGRYLLTGNDDGTVYVLRMVPAPAESGP